MAAVLMIFPKLYQPQKSQTEYREDFFSRPWPWAYFLSWPNAAASIALGLPDRPLTEQAAAVMAAKGRMAAATYRVTLAHAAYSLYFTLSREMPLPKLSILDGNPGSPPT